MSLKLVFLKKLQGNDRSKQNAGHVQRAAKLASALFKEKFFHKYFEIWKGFGATYAIYQEKVSLSDKLVVLVVPHIRL